MRMAWGDRRRLLKAGGLVLASTACRPDQEPAPRGMLTIVSGEDESRGGQRRLLLERWNEQNPSLPARIDEKVLLRPPEPGATMRQLAELDLSDRPKGRIVQYQQEARQWRVRPPGV